MCTRTLSAFASSPSFIFPERTHSSDFAQFKFVPFSDLVGWSFPSRTHVLAVSSVMLRYSAIASMLNHLSFNSSILHLYLISMPTASAICNRFTSSDAPISSSSWLRTRGCAECLKERMLSFIKLLAEPPTGNEAEADILALTG